ncbi:DUF3127 domain-containing protein [uncultured Flavobacterium sp.]|uniref:DUF3127 domain-containing protein n=1 Tax=uncultured Flavobacterium sp. TaxID=165435 RepID=UPI0030EE81B0|tara:strand:+ start:30415 stop:30669 length:255 start_codon:yes stop_codon:yes gene_type:complete
MEVSGKVVVVGQTESVGQNGFTKRLLVVETEGQHPQKLPIDFVKDNTNLLDNIQIGQVVKVQINLRGSEHNGRWYLQAQGWRIE